MGKHAKVMEGTVLNSAVSPGKVVATPVQRKKLSLSELLAKVNKKHLHEKVDLGSSPGRETW
jgi:antitoxin component of MazEF toxin-antitoxin module